MKEDAVLKNIVVRRERNGLWFFFPAALFLFFPYSFCPSIPY